VEERTLDLERSRTAALNMMEDAQKARHRLEEEIKERERAEAKLLQSQKMETVGTLAGGIAHDLNNGLTPVIGYLDLLLNQIDKNSPLHPMLTESKQSAKRCVDVVERLLNFSRPSTQKKMLLDVGTLMKEHQKFIASVLPSSIRVESCIQEGLWPVLGNETELGTVLMNLSVNARDAMPYGGTLGFEVSNVQLDEGSVRTGYFPGAYVLVTVCDTGLGIPADILPRIFEPFFTTKKKGKGSGLGLSMAYTIMQAHGGWIDVSSSEDRGTTFHLYFPARPGEKAGYFQAQEKENVLPCGCETILLADDEDHVRNMARSFLERLGYTVLLASDGEEAIRVYRENRDAVAGVILDMTMPKLTGKETIHGILSVNPKAKIIVASGYTAEGNPKDLIQEGVRDYLQKPYTILAFSQTLRKVLDNSSC